MNASLLMFGLAKAAFGIVVGACGIFAAARTLHRLIGFGKTDGGVKAGNEALGVMKAGSLIALGLLLQHAVRATFDALDLLYQGHDVSLRALRSVLVYGLMHVSLSIVVGALVLALGTWLFTKLTRGVNELEEIRKGNVAPAVVLAAVMVVLALMTSPGLQTALDGLLPLPELARDEVVTPS